MTSKSSRDFVCRCGLAEFPDAARCEDSCWRKCHRWNKLQKEHLIPKIYFCHQNDSTNHMMSLAIDSHENGILAYRAEDSLSNVFVCLIHVFIYFFMKQPEKLTWRRTLKIYNQFCFKIKWVTEISPCRRELSRFLMPSHINFYYRRFFTATKKFLKLDGKGILAQCARDSIPKNSMFQDRK